ncbi:MAG: amidase [Rhodocyclaceae bacterium]|nr:amidase [Rhodocyclaceae bacterium]MCA4902600.1 amidase [Rhodocyclaceae bacterium]
MRVSSRVAGPPEGSPLRVPLPALADAIAAGRLCRVEYARACIEQALAVEPMIHAFKAIEPAMIRARVEAAGGAGVGAPSGLLAGVPFGVKDIIDVRGLVTGMGSPIHDGSVADADAPLVARLQAAGGFVFGKTVTTEFAFMHPRETRNPWNTAHTPGGSSSGSAAAVAAGCVPAALATQTNGSVIRPAAFCGIVGFKPSYGAFPVQGVLSYAPTLDQAGCYARSVDGVTRIAQALAEPGFGLDAGARQGAFGGEAGAGRPRLAAVRSPVWAQASAAMQSSFERAQSVLSGAGARVECPDLPAGFERAHDVHRVIMGHEAVRYFEPVQARHRSLISDWLNGYLDQAAAIGAAEYRDALGARERLRETFARFVSGFDAVLTPPAIGEAPDGIRTSGDPVFCSIWTLLGTPAITIPTGLGPAGLPLGLQLVGAERRDAGLLAAAAWCESMFGFQGLPPVA